MSWRCLHLRAFFRPRPPAPGLRSSSSAADNGGVTFPAADLSQFGPDRIRNFSIVAHVDHGKSTLADRILEHVGAISKHDDNKQILDKLQVERERGITVKAQTASIIFRDNGIDYLLNLIDTPGHVDFSSEVSRSLTACQGVILLVDANQGVQAQTLSNFYLAFASNLTIVPVLNKIDLPNADPELVKSQLKTLLEIDPETVLLCSAKTGAGVADLLTAVVRRIPNAAEAGHVKKFADNMARKRTNGKSEKKNPKGETSLRLLVMDSWYDRYRGVVLLAQVASGQLRPGDSITSLRTAKTYPSVKTLSALTPHDTPVPALYPGQMGAFTCNMRAPREALPGDTFFSGEETAHVEPLLDFRQPKLYTDLPKLKEAMEKICLNDASVTVEKDSSPALGSGWRLGFLGVLHMEVFSQRLEQEYGASVVLTSPSVPYRLIVRDHLVKKFGGKNEIEVTSPSDWPDSHEIASYREPVVRGTVISPHEHLSAIQSLSSECRGQHISTVFIDQTRVKMEMLLPLVEIVADFFDDLKSLSSGYASFDYESAGYVETKLVKMDVLLNGKVVPEMAVVSHAGSARKRAKAIVKKLCELLPRQQFAIAVQVAVNSKILARGDVRALKKDVTAKCYGGDMTRKMKLLKRQAEGKKHMRTIGNVEISKDTFVQIVKKR